MVAAQKDHGFCSWNPNAAPFWRWDLGLEICLSETQFPNLLTADNADLLSLGCLQDQDVTVCEALDMPHKRTSFLLWGFSLAHIWKPLAPDGDNM